MPKPKSPEQFIASSPTGEKLLGMFHHNLGDGALRITKIITHEQSAHRSDGTHNEHSHNVHQPTHRALGNHEAKVAEALESGYCSITHPDARFVQEEIADLLIKKQAVPEAYFALQERITRKRGQGEVVLGLEEKQRLVDTVQADQADSLTQWSTYLRSDENEHVYPDWFKVYVWESLKTMGEYDKAKGEFKKRTGSTTASWPELNAEALVQVYDAIDQGVIRGEREVDDQLALLLGRGDFAALYAAALADSAYNETKQEVYQATTGSWTKYERIASQHSPNYTNDGGEYTNESREDDAYDKTVENTRRLTDMERRVYAGEELTTEDLEFLWLNERIEGFGLDVDPRASQLLEGRDYVADFDRIAEMIGYDELYWTVVEGDEGRVWNMSKNYFVDRIDRLSDESRDDLIKTMEYDKYLDNIKTAMRARHLYQQGVEVITILDRRFVCQYPYPYRVVDDGNAIADRLIAAGADAEYTNGVLKVIRNDPIGYHSEPKAPERILDQRDFDNWLQYMTNTVGELPCDDATRQRIMHDVVQSDLEYMERDIFLDNLSTLAHINNDNHQMTRCLLATFPAWWLKYSGRVDQLAAGGLDRSTVEEYISALQDDIE